MNILSIVIIMYLGIGLLFAVLSIAAAYWAQKHASHDEDAKEFMQTVDKVKTLTDKPYLFVALASILFWPKALAGMRRG